MGNRLAFMLCVCLIISLIIAFFFKSQRYKLKNMWRIYSRNSFLEKLYLYMKFYTYFCSSKWISKRNNYLHNVSQIILNFTVRYFCFLKSRVISIKKNKCCASFKNNNQTSNIRKTLFKAVVFLYNIYWFVKKKHKKNSHEIWNYL